MYEAEGSKNIENIASYNNYYYKLGILHMQIIIIYYYYYCMHIINNLFKRKFSQVSHVTQEVIIAIIIHISL